MTPDETLPPLRDVSNPYAPPQTEIAPGPWSTEMSTMRFTLGDILDRTWSIYAARMGTCIGLVACGWAIVLVPFLILSGVMAATEKSISLEASNAIVILGMVVVMATAAWIQIGLAIVFLDVARGKGVVFAKILGGGRYLLRVATAVFLFVVALQGVLLMGFLPAIIVASVTGMNWAVMIVAVLGGFLMGPLFAAFLAARLSQTFLLIVDRDAGLVASFRDSYWMTRGREGVFLAIGVVMSLVSLAGAMACFIGQIFTIPFTTLMFAVTYLALTGQGTVDPYSKGEPMADLELE